ncbi:MAG TPA: cytochrome c-type biogenesis CcmF C-terminal domain-containing protein, partial [Acidimicrobiales bacterium]|nr:cytochrome c-type biogenesis CcmF C-terminal domain-containing protein [Acidimicrobiales bacterium]
TESPIGPSILGFFALVVAVSIALIGWRGDALRSPGSIDAPVSRESAFLANNVAFAAFAFVVLLGTIFPLLAEAINGDQLSVGAPYFNRMTAPIGFTLLFLMAVAPALPWRKASTETLHRRLLWPAWAGTLTVVACVAFGLRGLGPLLAFGLAAFAAAAALRHLGLSVRAARRAGQPMVRALMGRSNGGMVVHLGVVLVAVGFAASSSYGHRAQFRLAPGQSASLAGHTVTYLGTTTEVHSNKRTTQAQVRVDGGEVYEPALHQFPFGSQAIGSPSVRTGPFSDVYLTLVVPPDPAGTAVIGVNIQPLVAWLWTGGAVMGFGTFLAAWPGRRRRRPAEPGERPAADPEPVRAEPVVVS